MWFRNLQIYRLAGNAAVDAADLETRLAECAFSGCPSQQPWSIGWVPPDPDADGPLVHAGSGFVLLCARREERLLPAAVVREAVAARVDEIEAAEGRRVGRRQRAELREDLTFEMLPKAFTRSRRIPGLLLPEAGLVLVDAASRARAEEWLELLRDSLGSLPVAPVRTALSPVTVFTGWLDGTRPMGGGLAAGDRCELRSPLGDGAVCRVTRQDLGGDELRAHLDAGKQVYRLALEWNEALSFVLTDALEVKQLRFADTLVEEAADDGAADAAAAFDAGVHLMTLQLARLLPVLWEAFGGLEDATD